MKLNKEQIREYEKRTPEVYDFSTDYRGKYEVYDFIFDINDYIVLRFTPDANDNTPYKIRVRKIYYNNSGEAYFNWFGFREYLKNFIRVA